MANQSIKSSIQGKPADLKIGSSPHGSKRNVKRIDELTLADYRRGVRKVLDESQVTSRA